MSIEAIAEPLSTGDQASGGAGADRQQRIEMQPRDDAAGPPWEIQKSEVRSQKSEGGSVAPTAGPRLAVSEFARNPISSDALVRLSELVGIDPKCPGLRGIRKRAERGFYGTPVETSPVYLLAVDRLPEATREAVLSRRYEQRREERRTAMDAARGTASVYHLPVEMFHDVAQAEGRQRAEFVREVDAETRGRRYQNQDEIFMAIVGREWRARAEGRAGKYAAISKPWGINGWRKARASYFVWAKKWKPWRLGDESLHNYHVLCDHRGFASPKTGAQEFWAIAGALLARQLDMPIAALYQAAREKTLQAGIPVALIPEEAEFHACYGSRYKRSGDARFWDLMRAGYEHPNAPELTEAYSDAVTAALRNGVSRENIPTFAAVKYFYGHKANHNAVAASRDPKLIAEQFAYSAICTSQNVFPNSCWVLDGRIMDVWVKQFEPNAGPLDPATGRRTGGWRAFRPVMTHLIDSSSFFQVSFVLGQKPNRDTCEFVLRSGVEDRGGVPVALHTDNGKDFSAALRSRVKLPMDTDALQKVSEGLGMRVIFAIHRNPQAKLIELYHSFMLRFERKLPGYHGHNKRQQDNLWRRRAPDGKTLAERLDHYPDDHPVWPGCLKDPDHCGLLTLDQFRQAWTTWRDEKFNPHVMKGPIMRGLSPSDKYLRAGERQQDALRPLTTDEITMAFLREYAVTTVKRGGSVYWTCDGLPRPVRYTAFDANNSSMLSPWIGREVQLRVDPTYDPPRMFVFEPQEITRSGEAIRTWRLIRCNGEFGSVPNETELEKYIADKSQIKDAARRKRGFERDIRRGHNAAAERDFVISQLQDLGVAPGAPAGRNGDAYTIAPERRQFQTDHKRDEIERQKRIEQTRKEREADPELARLAKLYDGENE